jgi:hypothetical protein
MQQRIEEFINKTATERLKALAKSGLLVMLAVSSIVIVVIPVIFIILSQRAELHREQAIYERAIAQAALDALPLIEFAITELRSQKTDKAKAISALEQARDQLSRWPYAIRGVDKRSTLEPEWKLGLITSAYAQSPPPVPTLPSEAKRWLLGGVLGVLAIVFIISIVAIFMTKDAEVLRFAFDTVKTLMGFFIGVATTLIGST